MYNYMMNIKLHCAFYAYCFVNQVECLFSCYHNMLYYFVFVFFPNNIIVHD